MADGKMATSHHQNNVMTTSNVGAIQVERLFIQEQKFIKFTFKGLLTHTAAKSADGLWRENVSPNQNNRVNLIFDCHNMHDYEPLARTHWQKLLQQHRNQIDQIWVLSDSKLIKAGAAIMGVFTSFNIKTASTVEQVAA
jgi:hypothetical protein